MKGKIYIVLIVLLIILSSIVYAQPAKINPHNFSTNTWGYSERCNPCHVDNPENKTEKGFSISYESDSLSKADTTGLSGISKLCFACHDGTVAGFNHITDFDQAMNADGMSHNHPISIFYKADSLARYKLYNPDLTMSGLGGTISEDLLVNGRVECTSCHDPHFSMTKTSCKSCPPGRNNEISSLWVKNNKSVLCLICHNI